MSKPKDAKTYREQLDILKARGLVVHNEPFALHCLEHHNYYRLSPYRFPFTHPGNRDIFLPSTSFEALWKLYAFDRKLPHLVIEACKSVEVSLRARWAYEVEAEGEFEGVPSLACASAAVDEELAVFRKLVEQRKAGEKLPFKELLGVIDEGTFLLGREP